MAVIRGAVSSGAATARTRSRPAIPCPPLCDGTDRGFVSFDDGTVVARTVMQSNTFMIKCLNNGATVVFHRVSTN